MRGFLAPGTVFRSIVGLGGVGVHILQGDVPMSLGVTPIDATLGAVVTGVDLAALDDETWKEIHLAFLKDGVLARISCLS